MGMMKNRFGANYGTTAMRVDYNTLTITEDDTLNQDDGGDLGGLSDALGMLSN